LSTQLPAPVLEWESEYFLPVTIQTPDTFVGTGTGFFDRLVKRFGGSNTVLPSTAVAAHSFTGYSTVGVGASTIAFATKHQRRCVSCAVSAGANDRFGNDWRPPDWLPHFGDPATISPGATVLPGAVVGVFDWNLACTIAAGSPSWPDDCTGVYFQRNEAAADTIPGVAVTADVEGCGVFVNSDGAGGTRFEYVSWAAGAPGAILQRTPIPVPDITAWSTVRLVVITAANARELNVQVFVNGTQHVDAFAGTAQLARFNASGVSSGPVNRILVGTGPDTLFFQMSARFGRFTPAGIEVQGQ
jgi:hypothetical protein